MIPTTAIVIRQADTTDTTGADSRLLAKLAALDCAPPLSGPALLAEVDGVARAAIDLVNDRVVADPFAPTADLVELLHLRARRLRGEHEPSRRRLHRRVSAAMRRPRPAHVRA